MKNEATTEIEQLAATNMLQPYVSK